MAAKLRILVIDDEPDVRAILGALLEEGFEVVEADNGLDALLAMARAEPDLIIVDLMMPIMDGWEFSRRARTLPGFSETPMIFLSALDSREWIAKGYKAGASLYLTKPFEPERVLKNVQIFAERNGLTPRPKRHTIEDLLHPTPPPVPETLSAVGPPHVAPPPSAPPSHDATPRPTAPISRTHMVTPPVAASPPSTPPSHAATPRPSAPISRTHTVTPPVAASPPPEPAPPRPEPVTPHATPNPAAPPRVMIIDDDTEVPEILRPVLEPDFEVVTAKDGLEAIQRIHDYEPDVFVLDIMLPKTSGLQLLQMIRQTAETAVAPVIVLSAKASVRDREYAANIGANSYITKPFMASEVTAEIRRWIKRPGFTVRWPKKKSIHEIIQEETQQLIVELQRKKLHLLHETEALVSDFLHQHGQRGPFTGEPPRK